MKRKKKIRTKQLWATCDIGMWYKKWKEAKNGRKMNEWFSNRMNKLVFRPEKKGSPICGDATIEKTKCKSRRHILLEGMIQPATIVSVSFIC